MIRNGCFPIEEVQKFDYSTPPVQQNTLSYFFDNTISTFMGDKTIVYIRIILEI